MNESFGVNAVEEMAIGLPVIVSEDLAVKKEIASAMPGLWSSDPGGRRSCDSLLDGNKHLSAMSANARTLVARAFSPETIADRQEAMYRSLIERGRRMRAALYRKAQKAVSMVKHSQYRQGLRFAVAPAVEHEAMLRSLPPVVTIVDVGANRGQFTLVALRFHPGAKITAFEPLPSAGDRFARIFRKNHGVVLHRVALGSRSEDAELNVSAQDDSSSLLPITDLQEATFPGTGLRMLEPVKIKRLDEVLSLEEIPGPALMKVDVQGGDLDVLIGAGELLAAFDFICVEVSFLEFYSGQPMADQVLRFMEESSFTLLGVYNSFLDSRGRSVQADFLFGRIKPEIINSERVPPGRQ